MTKLCYILQPKHEQYNLGRLLKFEGKGMKRLILVLVAGIFLSPIPVCAEIYRYMDASGVIRFTDNLADVPEAQRPKSVYENTPDSGEPATPQQSSDRNETADQLRDLPNNSAINPVADIPQIEEGSNGAAQIDTLLKSKMALDAEYAQIMKESLALSEERKTVSDFETARAYNDKVAALNARTDDYEMRRAAFQKNADTFNAGLKERLDPSPQPPQSPAP